MIKIKINASDEIREVTFSRHNEHVIELGGIADAPTTGFTTWRMDGVTQLGDFSGYTTVYRTLDNAVQLSNDGSVYGEPEGPEPGHNRRKRSALKRSKTRTKPCCNAFSK